MTTPGTPSDLTGTPSPIARGDNLARRGDWSGALTQWRQALDSGDATEASRRIRWFLRETGQDREAGGSPSARRRAYAALLGALVLSIAGTAITMIGIGRSGTESTIIAIAAWICFGFAIATVLVFAKLLGTQADDSQQLSSGDSRVTEAIHSATRLDESRD